ncbi:MAG TPA: YcxB family protein [Armatimonadota bacterium]|jgi:hypothetical protein
MTVKYEMTQADYWALNRYVYTHDRRQRLFVLGAILLMPLIAFVNLWFSGLPHWFAWLAAAVALVVWAPGMYGLLRFRVWSQLRAWPADMRRIEITLAEDGVHLASPKSVGLVSWDGVVRVAQDSRAVFLFLSRQMSYVVPARAFGSEAERAEFVSFASSHVEQKA